VSALGERGPVRRDEMPLPAERTDRALLSGALDLGQMGLLPGDTLRYWAVATDNSPGRQSARSREFCAFCALRSARSSRLASRFAFLSSSRLRLA
jgi:hypothetical protein